MEKSIESIWKEGFLNKQSLIAPKISNLYDKKSLHIITKFRRMFFFNIWGIIIFSSLIFIGSYLLGAILAGSIVFIMMMYVAYISYNELKSLDKIDKSQNSYLFLISLKTWIYKSIERYGKLYRIVYPTLILTFYFGIWFSSNLKDVRLKVSQQSNLIFGLHLGTTVFVLILALLISMFSKAIHRKDVMTIYGGILNKLDECLKEMEELRK
jgi:hypothetical protein